jgi:hypothetical protein
MWLGCCPQTKEKTLPESSQYSSETLSLFPPEDGRAAEVSCVVVAESPRGGYWTLSTSGYRSAAAASLSSVLVTPASIPPKYYLSSTACQGILRRAERRGKALPPMLEQALRAVVETA